MFPISFREIDVSITPPYDARTTTIQWLVCYLLDNMREVTFLLFRLTLLCHLTPHPYHSSTIYTGHIDASINESRTEYKSIKEDILIIAAPDFEVPGVRKIETAHRMRTTYRCLKS